MICSRPALTCTDTPRRGDELNINQILSIHLYDPPLWKRLSHDNRILAQTQSLGFSTNAYIKNYW